MMKGSSMRSRWIVAALGAVALALVSLPLLSTRAARPVADPAGAPMEFASAEGGCDARARPASLDFTLTDMNGEQVKLAQYAGRPILLNFWATWCGPCKFEIPAFVELQDKYREEGFVVLGVSVDDPADALRAFAADYKMNYPVLMADEAIQEAYGPIFAIPVSFFIKKDGTICKKHFGPATKEQFETDVRALF